MRGWDAERIARAAGARALAGARAGSSPAPETGSPDGDPGPVGVTVDSRKISPGELFVGLAGERSDGGEYAIQALAGGAWGVLVTAEHGRIAVEAIESGETGAGGPGKGGVVLTHPDPLAGLQLLARSWLSELRGEGARVVAITGSTGKTSTKDILGTLLAQRLATVSSPENHNTEIGLPLAILGAPAGTQALVLELAMRGPGQIGELTGIAEPDVGVIVNVGPVHLELLGSVAAVAAAKAELIAGLESGASVVIPACEGLLEPYLREDLHTIRFGPGGDIELAESEPGRVVIEDHRDGGRIVLEPSFEQAHNLSNLLAAVAAARALGVTPGGEVNVRFSALRGERVGLAGEIVLIDDCYNANPMSMRAAIDDLVRTAPGRRVAVLGDMLELGPRERDFHEEIGAYAAAGGVGLLVTVGPLAAHMADGFSGEVRSVSDADGAAALLGELLAPGDTVLVKGSRGVGLEGVGAALARTAPGARVDGRAGARAVGG